VHHYHVLALGCCGRSAVRRGNLPLDEPVSFGLVEPLVALEESLLFGEGVSDLHGCQMPPSAQPAPVVPDLHPLDLPHVRPLKREVVGHPSLELLLLRWYPLLPSGALVPVQDHVHSRVRAGAADIRCPDGDAVVHLVGRGQVPAARLEAPRGGLVAVMGREPLPTLGMVGDGRGAVVNLHTVEVKCVGGALVSDGD